MDAIRWQRAVALFEAALETGDKSAPPILAGEPIDTETRALAARLLAAHRQKTVELKLDLSAPLMNESEMPVHVGPFELLQCVGRGGMGSVWRARYRDQRVGRELAIKLPEWGGNVRGGLLERFKREGQALARLSHPSIARLYDLGVSEEGQPYLAMEFIEGSALNVYCRENDSSLDTRVRLMIAVARAVQHAHQNLILHRDLKPANIVVDTQGEVKLLDFGVAGFLDHSETGQLTREVGAPLTLAYAAPEQITGEAQTTATDVFSCAVVFYELLAGDSPYGAARERRHTLEQAIVSSEPPLLNTQLSSSALREIGTDIQWIVHKALKKDPLERYASMQAFADDLERALAREPVSARQDTVGYRLRRFVSRHRVSVAASAGGVTALLAALALALSQAQQARQQAELAQSQQRRVEAAQRFVVNAFAATDPDQRGGAGGGGDNLLRGALVAARDTLKTDPQTLLLVLKQFGEIYFRRGDREGYRTVQLQRIATLETLPSVQADAWVEALCDLARAQADSDGLTERKRALETFERAWGEAKQRGAAADWQHYALASWADQLRVLGQLDAAQQRAEQALAGFQAGTTPSNARYIAAIQVAALVARDRGAFALARERLAEVQKADLDYGSRSLVDQMNALSQWAALEFEDGDYKRAEKIATDVLARAQRETGDTAINLASARRTAVRAASLGSSVSKALPTLSNAIDEELSASDLLRRGLALWVKARLALTEGDLAAAGRNAAAATQPLAAYPFWLHRLQLVEIERLLRSGESAAALAMSQALDEKITARGGANHLERGPCLELEAIALWALGRSDEATVRLAQATRLLTGFDEAHPRVIRVQTIGALMNQSPQVRENSEPLKLLAMKLRARHGDTRLSSTLDRGAEPGVSPQAFATMLFSLSH